MVRRLGGGAAIIASALLWTGIARAESPFVAEEPNALRFTEIKGLGVFGLEHRTIGRIEDLVVGRDGKVAAVVLGVGGFLGAGEKQVAVPFTLVLWNTGDVTRQATPPGSPAGSGADAMPGAAISDTVLAATAKGTEVSGET
ncbi:MAG: PRC-barrel domain-containing protein, partial [Methylobacteriaceae bacterium]|nr:PRC-barrel domain-containing protein [Methylobacteriaceae bacterium]